MDSRQARHITVAVRSIGLRTGAGILLPPRRLRILPNLGIRSPAGAQRRRPQSTAIRRRTSILINPQDDLLVHPSPNILRRSNGHSRPILHRQTAAINPRPVAPIGHRLHPAPQVPKLDICKPATLLLVEKDDGASREVLALSRRNRSRSVALAQRQCSTAVARTAAVIFASSRPFASTRKPKSFFTRISRLPRQLLLVSPGGLVSQYPTNEKCCRNAGKAASPGYSFRSNPRC